MLITNNIILACMAVWSYQWSYALRDNEPICYPYSAVSQLIEKVTRLETKMENVEMEMKYERELLKLTREIGEISGKVNDLGETVEELKELHTKTEKIPLVVFSAYNPTSKAPGDGEIVVFQTVLLNEGSGYNPATGIFTATVAGLYQFSAHFCNVASNYVAYAIVHNETEVAISTMAANMNGCSSVNSLVKMEAGDRVSVRGTYGSNQLNEDRYRRASFLGVLIRE